MVAVRDPDRADRADWRLRQRSGPARYLRPERCWVTNRTLVPLLAGLILLISGCSLARRAAVAVPTEVPIEVVNQNPYDAQIFRMAEGERALLGIVEGESTATLSTSFPPSRQMSVEVRLLPVGSYRAWAVVVSPGEPVRIEIPSDLHLIRARRD